MDNATALKALEYWRETLIENELLRAALTEIHDDGRTPIWVLEKIEAALNGPNNEQRRLLKCQCRRTT
jgi:hypothetical protein